MNKMININEEKVFVLFFIIIAAVDSLNGYLIRNIDFPFSVGQVYRGLLILFLIHIIFKYKQFRIYPVLMGSFLVLQQFGYFAFVHQSLEGLMKDLIHLSKLLLIVLIIEAFMALKRKGSNSPLIEKVLYINLIAFPLFILIPKVFNTGYSMYSGNVGFSGFFYAANDLNVVLMVLFIFSSNSLITSIEIRNQKSILIYSLITLGLLLSLLLLGSKSSVAFTGLTILIYLIVLYIKYKDKITPKIYLYLLVGLLFICSALFLIFNDEIAKSIDRHSYFFQKQVQNENDLFSFIVTGRDTFLDAAIDDYNESEHKFFRFNFGIGNYSHGLGTAEHFFADKETMQIEMDFFDTFFSYGLLGTILIYGYFILIILSNIKIGQRVGFPFYLSFCLVFLYSFLGGHVLYSALSGSFLALICAKITAKEYWLYLNKRPFF
ncbi:O-antigen ligase family protein [Bacillus sp. JJ1521]|uniref:O-antigen ligase family protein n=1 Tax=Bacillus sp. JJ1521 TaxID=3122957 RepID=UPI0030004497